MMGSDRDTKLYDKAIERAYLDEDRPAWRLQGKALRMWRQQAREWKRQEREGAGETDQVLDALSKADTQALRLALVLSEFSEDYSAGEVVPDTMRSAIAIVSYCIDVWRYLTPSEFLAIRYGDEKIFRAAEAWHNRVVQAGGEAKLNDLYRAHVAGVRTVDMRDEVVEEYRQHWRVKERKNANGVSVMWLLDTEVEASE